MLNWLNVELECDLPNTSLDVNSSNELGDLHCLALDLDDNSLWNVLNNFAELDS